MPGEKSLTPEETYEHEMKLLATKEEGEKFMAEQAANAAKGDRKVLTPAQISKQKREAAHRALNSVPNTDENGVDVAWPAKD